jgi:hypothetical protein
MPRIGGVNFLSIDGVQFDVGESATVSSNNITRETVIGLTGIGGQRETHKAASIECAILHTTGAAKIGSLTAKTDCTVVLGTPQNIWTLRNAGQVGDPDYDAANGTYTIKFEGPECREVAV